MLRRIVIIIDFEGDCLEDDDDDDDDIDDTDDDDDDDDDDYDNDDDDSDLTQENASLRKSGGQSGQSAENALYSTPKF